MRRPGIHLQWPFMLLPKGKVHSTITDGRCCRLIDYDEADARRPNRLVRTRSRGHIVVYAPVPMMLYGRFRSPSIEHDGFSKKDTTSFDDIDVIIEDGWYLERDRKDLRMPKTSMSSSLRKLFKISVIRDSQAMQS